MKRQAVSKLAAGLDIFEPVVASGKIKRDWPLFRSGRGGQRSGSKSRPRYSDRLWERSSPDLRLSGSRSGIGSPQLIRGFGDHGPSVRVAAHWLWVADRREELVLPQPS
jgi:hypothetical protein